MSEYGKLCFSKKSDLLNIISLKSEKDDKSSFDSMAIDGAALVHLLPVNNVSTFDEYASMVFVPHIPKQLQQSTRVDFVWDTYIDNNPQGKSEA